MKLLILLAFLGMAFAQYEDDVADFEGALDTSVLATLEWPQNDFSNAGALLQFAYSDVGNGSCTAVFPETVQLFHVLNAHIIPGSGTNPSEKIYQITAPAEWEAANGTVNALIIFNRDTIFNISAIAFTCDPADVSELSVYSFPQNTLMKEASSNVYYRPGFHKGDVLQITLPKPVSRFNFTTMDSEYTFGYDEDMTVFTLIGFKNEKGVDDMKEVHFSIDYLPGNDTTNWFSSSQVTVKVTTGADSGDETLPLEADY